MHPSERSVEADRRWLTIAAFTLALFLVAELTAALVGRSLALLADAGHVVTDVAALATSAWAIRLAHSPSRGRWTYGLPRAEIVSAAINGVTLLAMALLMTVESVQRLLHPVVVSGELLVVVAVAGSLVNVVASRALHRADHSGLNVRSAHAHVITDLYAYVGTAVAGVLIVTTGWARADSVASLFVVALMVRSAWGILHDAGLVLLEAAPDSLDLTKVRAHLTAVTHVLDVHDLHAWTVASSHVTLSAHVVVDDECFELDHAPQLLDAVQRCLAIDFDVEHATIQLEPASHAGHEGDLHP